MALHIRIAARRDFKSRDLWEMHTLRAKVFKDRLGWEVPIMSGMEIDGYDALEPHYMVIRRDDDQKICGCWRMLPTMGPYMLKDTFPELAHGVTLPEEEHVWELSRFAIETDGDNRFGFAERAREAMRGIVHFADENGISKYVTVTTTAVERLLRHTGIETTRMGPPLQIGVEKAVALEIHLGQKTRTALFGAYH